MAKSLIVGEIYCADCDFCALHQNSECMYASMNSLSYFCYEGGKLWCSNIMALREQPCDPVASKLLDISWLMLWNVLDAALTLPDEVLTHTLVAAAHGAWRSAVEQLRPGVKMRFIGSGVCVFDSGEVFRRPVKASREKERLASDSD